MSDACCVCKENEGRFAVHIDQKPYYLCGVCFIQREDVLKRTGKDLIIETEKRRSDPGGVEYGYGECGLETKEG